MILRNRPKILLTFPIIENIVTTSGLTVGNFLSKHFYL